MTIGNVFLTGGGWPPPELRRHESRHSDQWAVFGWLAFPVLYGIAEILGRLLGAGPEDNLFERWAGLEDGGYRRPGVIELKH
jgi:hypothetical protein